MKQLVVIVIVLVIVAAGIPVVVGTLTENRVMAQADQVSSDDMVAVTIRDYERGWLASSAKIDLNLSQVYQDRIVQIMIQNQEQPVSVPDVERMLGNTLTLAIDVSHGPIVKDEGLRLGLASSVIHMDPETEGLDKLVEKLGVPYLFEIRTRSGFSTLSEFAMDVPPLEFEDANGRFTFSGLDAAGTFDIANRHLSTNGQIDALEVESDLVSVTAEQLTLTGDHRMVTPHVWEGPMEMALQRITILSAMPSGPPFLQADNVGVSANATLNDARDRVDVVMAYHIDSVTGDNIELTDARLDMTARNFDLAAIEAYNELTQQALFDPGNAPPTMPAMEDTLYQFLVAEPSVEFGPLTFDWNGEGFHAVVRVNTDTEMLPQQVAFTLLDPTLWMRLFTLDAELDISQSMAERIAVQGLKYQIESGAAQSGQELDVEEINAMAEAQGPGMLGLLALQGMIEASDTGYRTRVTFAKGQLNVNGTDIPLGPQF